MPEISRFYGIIITMYYNDHAPPHFHARYGSEKGRFSIENLEMLEGSLGSRARKLVEEWAALHKEELIRDWEQARANRPLAPIAPLE